MGEQGAWLFVDRQEWERALLLGFARVEDGVQLYRTKAGDWRVTIIL